MSPFERLWTFMLKPWVAIPYLGFLVFSFLYLDKPLAEFLFNIDWLSNLIVLNLLTKLGLGLIYFPLLFISIYYFRYHRINKKWETRFWFLLLCVAIPNVICVVLKVILGRARPLMWFENHLYGFFGFQTNSNFWSLPSGHTTNIMSLVLGLSILFPRYFYALLSVGFTVALSRILLNQHYLTDVLSAFYLALIEIGILLYILHRKSWLTAAWKPVLIKQDQ